MDKLTKEQLESLINTIKIWKPPTTYTLFFSRELREYEKDLIEKEGLKYQIIPNNIVGLNVDPDIVYVVPNVEKPIKIAYQKELYKYDTGKVAE